MRWLTADSLSEAQAFINSRVCYMYNAPPPVCVRGAVVCVLARRPSKREALSLTRSPQFLSSQWANESWKCSIWHSPCVKLKSYRLQTSFNEVTVLKSERARKLGDETINALSQSDGAPPIKRHKTNSATAKKVNETVHTRREHQFYALMWRFFASTFSMSSCSDRKLYIFLIIRKLQRLKLAVCSITGIYIFSIEINLICWVTVSTVFALHITDIKFLSYLEVKTEVHIAQRVKIINF